MTYETVRDAAKELALNAIAIEKRDNSAVAASITFDAITVHERMALRIRRKESRNPTLVSETVEVIAALDAALM